MPATTPDESPVPSAGIAVPATAVPAAAATASVDDVQELPPAKSAKRSPLPAMLAALALIAGVVIAVLVLNSGGSSTARGQPFLSAAEPVPTNHVTGNGTANIHLDGDVMSVSLDTNGLLDGQPHALHIHAGGKGICPPGSAARPHNGHLTIATLDGIKYYGPPQVSMTLTGDTSVKSIVAFGRYPRAGDIRYSRQITIPAGVADAIRAGDAVVVVHGIDYNHNGLYDNILDRSDLSSALPGESTAPALCGSLKSTRSASAPGSAGLTAMTYTVSLHRYVAQSATPAPGFAALCHLLGRDVAALGERRPNAGSPS